MEKVRILVIHRDPKILEVVLRLINANAEWQGVGAVTDEKAVDLFGQDSFEIVLLGSGIDEQSERNLRSVFAAAKPSLIVLQHYGGGSGLLACEIKQALANRNIS